jgi:hypothetical protein
MVEEAMTDVAKIQDVQAAATMIVMMAGEEVRMMTIMAVVGMATMKDILKPLKKVGKAAVAEEATAVQCPAIHAMMMMTIAEEDPVEVVETETVVDGMVIMKDIPKLQKEDGEVVVMEAATAGHAMTMMTIAEEVHVAAAILEKDADGMVIQKDIQKQLNADGKAVAVAADVLQEAVMMTMMIVAVHAIHAVAAVVAAVVDMAAGSEILKDTPKQLSVAGATDKRLIVASCLERRMKFILLSFL